MTDKKENFNTCVEKGGDISTKQIPGTKGRKYRRVCVLGNVTYMDVIKTKKN